MRLSKLFSSSKTAYRKAVYEEREGGTYSTDTLLRAQQVDPSFRATPEMNPLMQLPHAEQELIISFLAGENKEYILRRYMEKVGF